MSSKCSCDGKCEYCKTREDEMASLYETSIIENRWSLRIVSVSLFVYIGLLGYIAYSYNTPSSITLSDIDTVSK